MLRTELFTLAVSKSNNNNSPLPLLFTKDVQQIITVFY